MNMHPIHHAGWLPEDMESLTRTASFKECGLLALSIVRRHGGPLHTVSGPITTGGVGSIKGNMAVLRGVIEHLASSERLTMFSQIPFEEKLRQLWDEWNIANPDGGYCMALLEDFYEPVFSSGYIKTLHFIHGHESSQGARWEHEGCSRWGIERRYLPAELSQEMLRRYVPV